MMPGDGRKHRSGERCRTDELENLEETRMEGIYGPPASFDPPAVGADAPGWEQRKEQMVTIVGLDTTRDRVIVGGAMALGFVLCCFAAAAGHTYGILWGVLVLLIVPALHALRRRDRQHVEQCECGPMCCGTWTVEILIVLLALLLVYIRITVAGGPWQGPGDRVATVDAFPPACTGNGYEMGCTRLVNGTSDSDTSGPHRLTCSPSQLGEEKCPKPGVTLILHQFDADKVPLAKLAKTAETYVQDSMPCEGGCTKIHIDTQFSDGTGFHATRMTGFFGFVDDIWVQGAFSSRLLIATYIGHRGEQPRNAAVERAWACCRQTCWCCSRLRSRC